MKSAVQKNRLIVKKITPGQFHREFVVRQGEELTLVLIAREVNSQAKISIKLIGPKAKAQIYALVRNTLATNFSLETRQIHSACEATSNLLVKAVLGEEAIFKYQGKIRVEKVAQQTDAYQRNENLLLSPTAVVESKPELEILANDVRCTHGATIGTINPAELWYLACRGIGRQEAEDLIVQGFINSAISQISDTMIANKVRRLLWQKI